MEEKREKAHSISWKDRMEGCVTGVTDVVSFDDNSIILETEQGRLTIKGKELHVGRLMLEQGEVKIRGRVDSMIYSGSNPAKKDSLIKRMFQ